MVRRRHRPEVRQVRPRARQRGRGAGHAADGGQRQPAAAPVPGRPGVRRVRPPRPRRHDRPARRPGPPAGRAARAVRGGAGGGRRGLRAVGRQGLAREPSGRGHPHRVAAGPDRRVHRGGPPDRRGRRGRRPGREAGRVPSSTRTWPPPSARTPRTILDGLDAGETWEAVIAAEPSLGVYLSPTEFDAALLAIADFVDLKSPYTLGHARAVSELAARGGRRRSGWTMPRSALLRRAGRGPRPGPARSVERHLGQARPARGRRVGAGADAPVPHRADAASVRGARPARGGRGAASRAPGRIRLSPGPVRRGDPAVGPGAGCRRRLPVDARASPAPTTPSARAGRGRSCGPR